ncbi:4Fe-4S dicluster domain-containing protein [Brenneria corticis]|uniref:4Fe-4S ferredoxin-type domain-containing protein n=1 Tax=Brenneria corticis TaxID=2173106 RepID=A0A2U1TS13_9GAMM|nr:4Fe-4S dicluster domain-containing protein [Brenneria sp. CFCC 11842]PWC12189.1 hypothetical protein DDT56_18285 [Brenneria sp. CFCC 11842]
MNMTIGAEVAVTCACVRNKSKRAACQQCVDYCSSGALTISENNTIKINEEFCTGCGGCVLVCPVMAIDGRPPQRYAVNGGVYMAATAIPSVKECLLYYQAGYRIIIVDENHSSWEWIIAKANVILQSMGQPIFQLQKKTQTDNDSYYSPEENKPGRRRFLRVDVIREYLKKPAGIKNKLISDVVDEYQLFNVNIDSLACSLCSSCLQLCPTGAFRYENQAFVVDEKKCVGCRLCQDSCPEQALEVTPGVNKRTVTSYPFKVALCTRCRQRYPSLSDGEHACPACRIGEKLRLAGQRIGINSLNLNA